MQAMLALFDAWDPVVYVDLHTTDGAKFEHDVSVQVEPQLPLRGGGLDVAARALQAAILARMTAQGHLPLPFYPCACGHLNVIGSKAELAERAEAR